MLLNKFLFRLRTANDLIVVQNHLRRIAWTVSLCDNCRKRLSKKILDIQVDLDALVASLKPEVSRIQFTARETNLLSDKFESEVAEFYRREHGYIEYERRYHPQFLGKKEIDLFARKRHGTTVNLLICECKLRFSSYPITVKEVRDFVQKLQLCERWERRVAEEESHTVRIYSFFVSNRPHMSDEAKELSLKHKVKFLHAKLPLNWFDRSDWRIYRIERIL